jgi:hypothetical protein
MSKVNTTAKKVKEPKPISNSFTRQTMLSWKPVLTPPWAVTIFVIITVIYIPIGLFIFIGQNSVKN